MNVFSENDIMELASEYHNIKKLIRTLRDCKLSIIDPMGSHSII
jgi:hypothetical protein